MREWYCVTNAKHFRGAQIPLERVLDMKKECGLANLTD